jgi:hypothetical protein
MCLFSTLFALSDPEDGGNTFTSQHGPTFKKIWMFNKTAL